MGQKQAAAKEARKKLNAGSTPASQGGKAKKHPPQNQTAPKKKAGVRARKKEEQRLQGGQVQDRKRHDGGHKPKPGYDSKGERRII